MLNESTKRRCIGLALAAVACALLPAVGWAQWIKLSDGMPFSDVGSFQISADGKRVVYTHDAVTDDAYEMWSVPITGGTPIRLSGLLPSGSFPGPRFRLSPDGGRVVYLAPQDNTGVDELYSAPIAGGAAPVRLNGALVTGGDVDTDFSITPDGARVLFRADQETDEAFELYSVPIAGGTPVRLNGGLVAGGSVRQFPRASDSGRVVYLADQDIDEVVELYSVPITGGAPVRLSGDLVAGGDVRFVSITPDGSRVLYLADQAVNGISELYSVPIAGGAAVKLNGAVVGGGGFSDGVINFAASPDGSRVVYIADQQLNDVYEIYSVPVAGGPVVKLNGTLVAGGTVNFLRFSITPDSSRVLYQADQQTDDVVDLYSVPIDGGSPPIKINGTLVPAGDVFSFSISPDGNWVVYDHDNTNTRRTGYHASPAGPAGSGELLWGTALSQQKSSYQIDPSSRYVVVFGTKTGEAQPVDRLWQAPLTGNINFSVRELIPGSDFVAGGNVFSFKLGPNGSIVYVADQDADEVYELYSISDELFIDGFE